jgi:hypothetical protein
MTISATIGSIVILLLLATGFVMGVIALVGYVKKRS